MKTEFRIFHRDIELKSNGHLMSRSEVSCAFPGLRVIAIDSFSVLAGYDPRSPKSPQLPVTRRIAYKVNGSKHECVTIT